MKGIRFSVPVSRYSVVLFIALFLAMPVTSAYAQNSSAWTGNVNIFAGYKNLDEDDWDPLDKQTELGIGVDFKQDGWPVSATVGYLRSSDDDSEMGIDIEGKTSELYLGVRKIWDTSPQLRPFVGGGLALVSAEMEAAALGIKVSDDDSGIGFWLSGGAYLTVSGSFNIGAELRYSKASVTLFNTDVEAGGVHYGLLLGYHW